MVGYDELSNLIGKCPDLAIVRRFGPLAAQVMIRMQAELLELQHDLQILGPWETQQEELCEHSRSWEKAVDAVQNGGTSPRLEKVLEAETKLLKYCKSLRNPARVIAPRVRGDSADEFLSRSSAVMKLGSPDPCDVDFLRGWLKNKKCGNNFLGEFTTVEATAWDEDQSGDLVTLNRRSDRFAAWAANTLVPTYHKRFGHLLHKPVDNDSLGSYYSYDDKRLVAIGNVLCTFLSTVIPSSSILVLFYVRDMAARLLLIIAFSSLFSLVMGFVANGRRYEIFAATIAFAAVQVVFVGNITVA